MSVDRQLSFNNIRGSRRHEAQRTLRAPDANLINKFTPAEQQSSSCKQKHDELIAAVNEFGKVIYVLISSHLGIYEQYLSQDDVKRVTGFSVQNCFQIYCM